MKTLGDVLKLTANFLKDHHIASPRRQAEDLLAALLKIRRLDIYMQFDRPLEEEELAVLRGYVKRRSKGEPLEYIVNETTFFDCSLEITPSVLIPRPETEILLDKILGQLKNLDLSNKAAWDLCTGSGCLGIALKKKLPQLEVTLSDISLEAIALAKKNAQKNNISVNVLQGDLFAPFLDKRADFIICNPPYVSEEEYLSLDREVKDFEPKLALVAKDSGLEFYARLAEGLPRYLNPGGKAFFEIGTGQGEAILKLFNAPRFRSKVVERDWAGHERFFFLEIE